MGNFSCSWSCIGKMNEQKVIGIPFKKGHKTWNKGLKMSIKFKEKLKKAKIGYKPNFGGKHHKGWLNGVPENIKKKISKSLKGHPVLIITREKIKEYRKNQIFPKNDTSIEIKIQNYLKQLKIEFFTHHYIKEIEHSYQCDILIPSMNMVIECDGNYWHKYPIGKEMDHIRTKELFEKGFKVLRLWEKDIKIMSIETFKNKLMEVKNVRTNMDNSCYFFK